MMKRWWVLALLLTLALSLTSCSKPLLDSDVPNYGYQFCQGSLGSFDVYIIPSQSDPTLFELSIIPVQLADQGDIVSITAANQSLSYKSLVSQVVVNNGEEIFGGDLTESDLENFNILAITPFDPTTNFLQSNSQQEALCQMPQPGDTGGD